MHTGTRYLISFVAMTALVCTTSIVKAQVSVTDATDRITNQSFETGDMTGWRTSWIEGDIGVRENANAIYTVQNPHGAYMFNTWTQSNSYTFCTPNQFVEQTINNLSPGKYTLQALVASDTYTMTTPEPVYLYANDAQESLVPPHKTTFTDMSLDFYVMPSTRSVTIGMKSACWFKCDNFRLTYQGETDDYLAQLAAATDGSGLTAQLVEYWNGYDASGWTFTETAPHTHGSFPLTTNNVDKTKFEAAQTNYWTSPSYQLGNARITRSYSGLTPGWYELRTALRLYDENGDFDGTASGLSLICGNQSTAITNGTEISEGNLYGKGFTGTYSVRAEVGSDGTLTIGFETKSASFNWFTFLDTRLLYYGTTQPVDQKYYQRLESLATIVQQFDDDTRAAFSTVYSEAQSSLKLSTSDSQSEAIIAEVRTAIIDIVRREAVSGKCYDLTPLITYGDMSQSADLWTLRDVTMRSIEGNFASIEHTTGKAASALQVLKNMPAGNYRLTAQAFYRTTEPTAYMESYERGSEDIKAVLRLGNDRCTLPSVMDGRRYITDRSSGLQTTIDGRAIPRSISAVGTWLDYGFYAVSTSTTLTSDTDLTLGIDIADGALSADWTVVGRMRLLYGNVTPTITLTDDDTEFTLDHPTTANIRLQRTFSAGVLSPLCLPFAISADSFDELYGIGSCDGKTAVLYPADHIAAGQPCMVKMYADTELIDFGEVNISPLADDTWILPWGYGHLQASYIKSTRREQNYSWKYMPEGGTTLYVPSRLNYQISPQYDANFSVTLENMSLRSYLAAGTYTQSSSQTLMEKFYKTPPPMRRDIPNPVMVPVVATGSDVYVEWSETSDFADAQRRKVLAGHNAYVPNLKPLHTYYYRVVSDGTTVGKGQFHTHGGPVRMIYAPSANNIRDLGGWTASNNYQRVRYGYIYRGSELNGAHVATDTDLDVLRQLGVSAEIDLRWNSSWDNDGVGISPFKFTDTYYFAAGNDWLASDLESNEESYRHWADEFRLTLRTIREGGAIYFHCVWGADRTGLYAMLLEGLLGLAPNDIFKDYELTSYSLAGQRSMVSWKDRLAVINGLSGPTLRDKFDTFFTTKLGITKEEIEEFRAIMLEDINYDTETVSEDRTYSCVASRKATTTVHISLAQGQRNAVVFPFSLSATEVKKLFGTGTKMEQITAYDGHEISTKTVSSMAANTPFLLTPAVVSDDANYTLANASLQTGGPLSLIFDGGIIKGNFQAGFDVQSAGTDSHHTSYVLREPCFYKANAQTPKLGCMHAYILLDTPAPSDATATIYFSGETPDAIESVEDGKLRTGNNSAVYDLQGRRIADNVQRSTLNAQLPRGVYIMGGKKMIVK